MKNLVNVKWVHGVIHICVGLAMLVVGGGSHSTSLKNPETVSLLSFGSVLIITGCLSLYSVKWPIDKLKMLYIILLLVSIVALIYSLEYIYEFNRTKGKIPVGIEWFMYAGILTSLIIGHGQLAKRAP